MADFQPFQSLLEASNRAKTITLGNFSLVGEDMTDRAQALVKCFNCYWETTIFSLQTQLRYFLINTYKAYKYEPDQFGSGPGLQICANIK